MKIIWPFVWRSTFGRLQGRLRNEIARNRELEVNLKDANIRAGIEMAKSASAESKMLAMQTQYAMWLRARQGEADIKMVVPSPSHSIAYMESPTLTSEKGPKLCGSHETIDLVRISCSLYISLHELTCPESVAFDIGKRAEAGVLSHWRDQSALLPKE